MWPCRQNLYVKKIRLRRNNNAYIENVAMSSKRKQLMRVKKKRIRLKRGQVVKTYTSKKIVCVEITTHTSKIWPCCQKENNLCVLKTTSSLEKEANAMVYAVLAVGRRAPTCNETMKTVVWKKLLF